MSLLAERQLRMQNPMKDALENWDRLQSDLNMANDQIKEMTSCNASLLAEVDYLRSRLDVVSVERDRYKNYSIEITTRLTGIKETILMAEMGAREFAMKPPVPTEAPKLSDGEVKEVESLVARLPPNALRLSL